MWCPISETGTSVKYRQTRCGIVSLNIVVMSIQYVVIISSDINFEQLIRNIKKALLWNPYTLHSKEVTKTGILVTRNGMYRNVLSFVRSYFILILRCTCIVISPRILDIEILYCLLWLVPTSRLSSEPVGVVCIFISSSDKCYCFFINEG